MELFYFARPGGNFGDDLNPWLWPRLLPGLFAAGGPDVFVGIGSILDRRLDRFAGRRVVLFGPGARSPATAPRVPPGWDLRFVRGPRTAAALGGARWVTDPALCVRLVDLGPPPPPGPVALMTHITSLKVEGLWRGVCRALGFRYISPEDPVEDTLRAIRGSRLVLAEAMHGAIVADAFRVPWVRLRRPAERGEGPGVNDFKWADWAESVGVNPRPVDLPTVYRVPGALRRLREAARLPELVARVLWAAVGRGTLSKDRVHADRLARLRDELDRVAAAYGPATAGVGAGP